MAFFDQAINFGKVTINGTGGLTASQTSITLTSGEGGKLPAFPGNPYNMVIFNATDFSDPADYTNREIVRVTDRSGDVLTVTRGQEGTTGFAHPAGKTLKMYLLLSKKFLTDLESMVGGRFRAVRSGGADQASIAADTDTKILFNAEDFDKPGEFDITNNRFVAAAARTLHVKAQLQFLAISALGKICQIRFYKNGSLYSTGEIRAVGAFDTIVSHSDIIPLAATDYVEVFARHNDVAARTVDGDPTFTYFMGI